MLQTIHRDFDFIFTNFFSKRYRKVADLYLVRFYVPVQKLDYLFKCIDSYNYHFDITKISERHETNELIILAFTDMFSNDRKHNENLRIYHNINTKYCNNIGNAIIESLDLDDVLAIKRFSKTKKKQVEFDFNYRINNVVFFEFNNKKYMLDTDKNIVKTTNFAIQTDIFTPSETPENIEKSKIIEKKFIKYLVDKN